MAVGSETIGSVAERVRWSKPMPAFFIDPDQIQDHRLSFSTDEAHHLRVRRIRQGEIVDAIDGTIRGEL